MGPPGLVSRALTMALAGGGQKLLEGAGGLVSPYE